MEGTLKPVTFAFLLLVLFSCTDRGAPVEQTPAASDTPQSTMHTEEVDYTADGLTLKGYLAYDKNVQGKRLTIFWIVYWPKMESGISGMLRVVRNLLIYLKK